jgi:hypothetical protein
VYRFAGQTATGFRRDAQPRAKSCMTGENGKRIRNGPNRTRAIIRVGFPPMKLFAPSARIKESKIKA